MATTGTASARPAAVDKAVSRALDGLETAAREYHSFFMELRPEGVCGAFSRWLFAQCTVQLSWQASVELYVRLATLRWPARADAVREQFLISGAGFHNTRPDSVCGLAEAYFSDPEFFRPAAGETFRDARARILPRAPGLGPAKTSFAMEMLWPGESDAVCLDRHMLRILDPGGKARYEDIESAWVDGCSYTGMAPACARLAFWDRLQGCSSPWYWACVFDTPVAAAQDESCHAAEVA